MQIERQVTTKSDKINRLLAVGGKRRNMDEVEFRVKVSGDLCHRSGYVQNDTVENLRFTRSTSRMVRLIPGDYSLTVFVGACAGRTDVDYSVELIPDPAIQLYVPGKNPIRAQTVGITGFVVIDFTLS